MRYTMLIQEEVSDLLRVEKKQQKGSYRDRIKLIRLLKEGYSLKAASQLTGVSYRQSQRHIALYRQQGLSALLMSHYVKNAAKLQTAELLQLQQELQKSQTASLTQAQAYIAHTFGKHYSLSGLSLLFARHKIKLKTGRPSNVKQNVEQQSAFKKTSPNK